jgi:hypothetical protein
VIPSYKKMRWRRDSGIIIGKHKLDLANGHKDKKGWPESASHCTQIWVPLDDFSWESPKELNISQKSTASVLRHLAAGGKYTFGLSQLHKENASKQGTVVLTLSGKQHVNKHQFLSHLSPIKYKVKKQDLNWAPVTHAYNPSYLGG